MLVLRWKGFHRCVAFIAWHICPCSLYSDGRAQTYSRFNVIQVLGAVEVSVQFSGVTDNIGGWIPKTRSIFVGRFTTADQGCCTIYPVLCIPNPKSRQQLIIYPSSPTVKFVQYVQNTEYGTSGFQFGIMNHG